MVCTGMAHWYLFHTDENELKECSLRLVLGLQPCDHIKPALFELHWLPVHLRINYNLCLLMHSATVQCWPRYISDIIQTTAASSRRQGLRSSVDTFSYTVPLTFTTFGEWAFSVAGRSVWNSLPADIRHITDISTFKHYLKTHLLTRERPIRVKRPMSDVPIFRRKNSDSDVYLFGHAKLCRRGGRRSTAANNR